MRLVPMQTLFRDGVSTGSTDAELLDRFVSRAEDAAFEAIVARHGRFVLNVCGSALRNPSDLEDAFQAVFLVLAQRAGSIRGTSIAPWLYRVSRRISHEANRRARVHARREAAAVRRSVERGKDDKDLDAVHELIKAIERLPEKYRSAVVLCELLEKTHQEAAEELGVSCHTVSARVSRARRMLKQKLIRAGVAPSSATAAWARSASVRDAVPTGWASLAVQTARRAMLGESCVVGISVGARSLAARFLKAAFMTRLKTVAALLIATGFTTGAVIAAISSRRSQEATVAFPREMQKSTPKEEAANTPQDRFVYQGTVRRPEGEPRPGVKVLLTSLDTFTPDDPIRFSIEQKTDAAGRFRIELSRAEAEANYFSSENGRRVVLYAVEKGFGPAWARVEPEDSKRDIDLRLVRDDTLIEGRLIDLEGKAVAGGKVSVSRLFVLAKV